MRTANFQELNYNFWRKDQVEVISFDTSGQGELNNGQDHEEGVNSSESQQEAVEKTG